LRYLKALLLTAASLLQDIKFPVFEQAVLTSLHQENDRAHAQVWMAAPEGLPNTVVDEWIKLAAMVLARFSARINDSAALELAYQDFESSHIKPSQAKIPGGQSTISILQAAFDQGIAFAHLGSGRYVLGWGAMSRIFDRSGNCEDSAIGAAMAQNKAWAVHLMKLAGVPTPRGVLMRHTEFSPKAMVSLSTPWVIKPVDRDRGEGVTLNLENIEQAQVAFDEAAKLSAGVLAEEQVPGTCHRILVIDGRVVYAVKRNPKTVEGDGVHSIAGLIELKNTALRRLMPIKRVPEYVLDDEVRLHLARMSLETESVPAPGVRIELRAAQSTRWGGDPEDVTPKIHPDNAAIAIKAAQLFRLRCAGIDLISQDIEQPWYANGAVINEVNFSPTIGRTHAYQRGAASAYVKAMFPEQGRVPIEVFLGKDMQAQITKRMAHWKSKGKTITLCRDEDPGQPQAQPHQGRPVFERIAMTRFDPTVQVLLVHLWREESLAWDALPFPWVSQLAWSESSEPDIKASSLWRTLAPLATLGDSALQAQGV
jgi:cyanophycin synthetase